jgi:hypothetical protein
MCSKSPCLPTFGTPDASIKISPRTLPDGVVSVAYSQQLGASGGETPYKWYAGVGPPPIGLTASLPAGLTLDSTTTATTTAGLVHGTPTMAGSFPFTVEVVDSTSRFNIQTYNMTITAAP